MSPLLMRGQEMTRIRGKVFYNNAPLEGVHIQNIDNQHYTTTDAEGSFSIDATKGQSLKATYVGKKTLYHTLTQVDLQRLIVLKMADITIALEEVSVTEKPKITAQSLGILQHTPVERTFAEKRLYSATHSAGGNLLSIDLLISTISGRKKLLKKIVANEQNLAVASYIRENMKVFLQKELKLNEEEIDVLAYYVMERTEFHDLVRKKENKQMEFMLIEAWGEYQRLAKAEK